MTKIELRESTQAAPVKSGNRWRVIVARPGVGSSGTYSEELFRRDAEKIIAPGGQMFINHDISRNPKDMLGTYPQGSYWDEDEKVVVAEAEIFSHWKDFVEEVGPHCGVSLFAMGESDEDGNITAIIEDPLNGADLVARPGLKGSGLAEKLYESAIKHDSGKPSATVAQEDGRNNMEKVEKALADLTDLVKTLVAKEETAKAHEAQVKADEAEAVARVEAFATAVEALDKAELLDVQRAEILEAAKKGADVAPLIESAIKVRDAALEAVKAKDADSGQGRIIGEAASTFGAWK